MTTTIRQETTEDFKSVYHIIEKAFGQDTESRLVDLLRQSSEYIDTLSLVAVLNEKIIGHCMFTRLTNKGESNYLVLAPVSVDPDHQGKGIGAQLIEHGIDLAKSMKFKGISVLGHAGYYPKFGFVKASSYKITCPYKVPDEAFMFMALADSIDEGEVVYSKAFDEV